MKIVINNISHSHSTTAKAVMYNDFVSHGELWNSVAILKGDAGGVVFPEIRFARFRSVWSKAFYESVIKDILNRCLILYADTFHWIHILIINFHLIIRNTMSSQQLTYNGLCTLFRSKSEDNPRNIRVRIKRQFEEILYPTLFFKEIIYLCERVDNLWARVARLANIKDKQSMDLWFRTLFFYPTGWVLRKPLQRSTFI